MPRHTRNNKGYRMGKPPKRERVVPHFSTRKNAVFRHAEREMRAVNKISRRLIQSYRLSCAICGKYDKLTFHHVDPAAKEYSLGSFSKTGISYETVKDEIEKCIVLCEECHKKLHEDPDPDPSLLMSETVFVTKEGIKYHRPSCPCIAGKNGSVRELQRYGIRKQGYRSCKLCNA